MAIMTRIVRLCRADIHGVVDQMENKGLILKQYLRDMERELDQNESMLKKILVSRDQAKKEYDIYYNEIENVEQDLKMALEKDEDNIGRQLIKKLKPLSRYLKEIGCYIETLDKEIVRHKECLKERRLQHERLRLRSLEYGRGLERSKWEKSINSAILRGIFVETSDAEIEIELLKRKEAIKRGEQR